MRIATSIAIWACLLAITPAAGAQGELLVRNDDAGCSVMCRPASQAVQTSAWRRASKGPRDQTEPLAS